MVYLPEVIPPQIPGTTSKTMSVAKEKIKMSCNAAVVGLRCDDLPDSLLVVPCYHPPRRRHEIRIVG